MQKSRKRKRQPWIGACLIISSILLGAVPYLYADFWSRYKRSAALVLMVLQAVCVLAGISQLGNYKSKKEMYITIFIAVGLLVAGGLYIYLGAND